MTTLTVTITAHHDGSRNTTIDRDPNSTPQEVLGLIVRGMIDATASVMLADSQMGPKLRTVEPYDGESVDEAARTLARGMAVKALVEVLPHVLAAEERAS